MKWTDGRVWDDWLEGGETKKDSEEDREKHVTKVHTKWVRVGWCIITVVNLQRATCVHLQKEYAITVVNLQRVTCVHLQ